MEILCLSPPEEVIKTRNETGITQKLASARLQSKSANRLMSMINVVITESYQFPESNDLKPFPFLHSQT